MTSDPHRPADRWTSWLQATPAELVGLCALLLGGLAVAGLLWWQAEQRPADLPTGPAHAGADHVGDRVDAHGEPHGEAGWEATGAEPAPAEPAVDVVVHVSGAVERPGLFTLPPGARVGDAIEAAGGPTADAEPERLNLARPLQDGEHVHLPRQGEELPPSASGPEANGAASGGDAPDGRVDLNRAGADELETLPGIGPSKAAAIIRHRDEHGPFRVPGDLRAVPGIGEKTFQALADLVAVG